MMRLSHLPLLIALPGTIAALFTATALGESTDPSPAADATGEALWHEYECGDCHEHAVEPGQPVIFLHHLSQRFNETTLAAFLAAPPWPMPNPGLSEQDRRTIAEYLLKRFP